MIRRVLALCSTLALALAGVLALGVGPAAAHEERPAEFPDGTGEVPTYLGLDNPRHRIVCAPESAERIAAMPEGHLKMRNQELLAECGFGSIQTAINSIEEQNTSVYILPGVYEERQWAEAPRSERCSDLRTSPTAPGEAAQYIGSITAADTAAANAESNPVALSYAEESYRELERRFTHAVTRRIPLIIYASHTDFEQTNILPFVPPEGLLGVTEFLKRRVALPFNGSYAEFRHTLRHELVHVFQLSLAAEMSARYPRQRHALMPLWWTEGLAEYETNIERPYWKREHNRELFLSLKHGDLWKISELSAAFTRPNRPNGVTIAYHQSSLVIHYLADTYGFPKLVEALKLYGEGKRDNEVLLAITGQQALLEQNPLLARSIRNRFPYLDPLNHVQIELLKRHRAGDSDERVVQAIHLTINGIAAGLRNSG